MLVIRLVTLRAFLLRAHLPQHLASQVTPTTNLPLTIPSRIQGEACVHTLHTHGDQSINPFWTPMPDSHLLGPPSPQHTCDLITAVAIPVQPRWPALSYQPSCIQWVGVAHQPSSPRLIGILHPALGAHNPPCARTEPPSRPLRGLGGTSVRAGVLRAPGPSPPLVGKHAAPRTSDPIPPTQGT